MNPNLCALADTVPISVIIPAHDRWHHLKKTLTRIFECSPQPEEVLVYVDGGSPFLLNRIRLDFPDVKLLTGNELLGPGGSRNLLIAAAKCEVVANFDDDSFPADTDYFLRCIHTADLHPAAAVLSAVTISPGKAYPSVDASAKTTREVPIFAGCGCVYRKSWFSRTSGYVPLPVAYSMEESDLCLRLCAIGGTIIQNDHLVVIHDRPVLTKQTQTVLNSHIIANIVLHGYLRYPKTLWPLIPMQILSRICWMFRQGWFTGISAGLAMIPRHISKNASYREPVPLMAAAKWLLFRKQDTWSDRSK